MPGNWAGSDRRNRLPVDWPITRPRILARDHHQCQIRGPRCISHATHVDHIVNHAAGGADDDTNYQAACVPCHADKSAGEGVHARRNLTALRRRPPRRHPGLTKEVRP